MGSSGSCGHDISTPSHQDNAYSASLHCPASSHRWYPSLNSIANATAVNYKKYAFFNSSILLASFFPEHGPQNPGRAWTIINLALRLNYGSRIRIWGNTCGGVREFAVIAFKFSGRRPSRGRSLKFGTAHSLGIFFDWEFFSDFFEDIFFYP
jgi:hypothetical protein